MHTLLAVLIHVTVTDTALSDTGNNVLSFTEDDNYLVANVKFTGNSL